MVIDGESGQLVLQTDRQTDRFLELYIFKTVLKLFFYVLTIFIYFL